MKICYIVAMRAEATPFIEHYGVKLLDGFFAPLPCQCYHTQVQGSDLYVVLNGEQHGSDLVGCEAASVATLAAIQKIQPDLVINSGTCGAFRSNGAGIGDVYLGSGVMFHDRRVPGDDAWGTQALGNYPVWEGTSALAQKLGFKLGKVTTGSSLDMQPCDEQIIRENHGELKDMEGAAVAFVCSLFHLPILFVKSVTDLCDSGAATFDEFSKNLALASENLRRANVLIIDELIRALQEV
jgi:nucleoside phosphorylase